MLKASDDDEERISIRVNTRIAHMMVMVALSCFTNTGTCSLLLDLTDVWIAHINACSIVQYDTIIYVASRHQEASCIIICIRHVAQLILFMFCVNFSQLIRN